MGIWFEEAFKNTQWRKPYKCNQCDYDSSHAFTLRTHLKTHRGEKSNKCNQCDYASSQAGSLRRHLKTHSGEKSNKCNQCDYASSEAGKLRRHLKTHSGQKPNKYNQCVLSWKRFEETFENAEWRKVKKQPMKLQKLLANTFKTQQILRQLILHEAAKLRKPLQWIYIKTIKE